MLVIAKRIKALFSKAWRLDVQLRFVIGVSSWIAAHVPVVGAVVSLVIDRCLMFLFGIELHSASVRVAYLSISHPTGVLLGGNGITSPGRVAVMSGVKFVAHSPNCENYKILHRAQRVFDLGDNVVIGANSVVIGPVKICSNVLVGAMSLVNRDLTEPGVYVGVPVKRISDHVSEEWFGV